VFSRRATHCANFIIREIRPRRRYRARRLRRIGGIAVSAVLNNERTCAAARSLPPMTLFLSHPRCPTVISILIFTAIFVRGHPSRVPRINSMRNNRACNRKKMTSTRATRRARRTFATPSYIFNNAGRASATQLRVKRRCATEAAATTESNGSMRNNGCS